MARYVRRTPTFLTIPTFYLFLLLLVGLTGSAVAGNDLCNKALNSSEIVLHRDNYRDRTARFSNPFVARPVEAAMKLRLAELVALTDTPELRGVVPDHVLWLAAQRDVLTGNGAPTALMDPRNPNYPKRLPVIDERFAEHVDVTALAREELPTLIRWLEARRGEFEDNLHYIREVLPRQLARGFVIPPLDSADNTRLVSPGPVLSGMVLKQTGAAIHVLEQLHKLALAMLTQARAVQDGSQPISLNEWARLAVHYLLTTYPWARLKPNGHDSPEKVLFPLILAKHPPPFRYQLPPHSDELNRSLLDSISDALLFVRISRPAEDHADGGRFLNVVLFESDIPDLDSGVHARPRDTLPFRTTADLSPRQLAVLATLGLIPLGLVQGTALVDSKEHSPAMFHRHDSNHGNMLPAYKNAAARLGMVHSYLQMVETIRPTNPTLAEVLESWLFFWIRESGQDILTVRDDAIDHWTINQAVESFLMRFQPGDFDGHISDPTMRALLLRHSEGLMLPTLGPTNATQYNYSGHPYITEAIGHFLAWARRQPPLPASGP